MEMIKYFGARDWQIENENILRLDRKLKAQGITALEFDMKTIIWKKYFENLVPGFKRYFFKESFENLNQLKMEYKR
jgi:Male sterility protein